MVGRIRRVAYDFIRHYRKTCIECGKTVWYPSTPFCKECATDFYNDKEERTNNKDV